jgi:hypothetical protein
MPTVDIHHTTPTRRFAPGFSAEQLAAGQSVPPIQLDTLAEAARVFFEAAMRSLPPQMRADFTTYQRLAAHEEQFAETATVAGRRDAAALARRCAARYRADAFAMLAKLPWVMLWEAWQDQEHHARETPAGAVVGECVA